MSHPARGGWIEIGRGDACTGSGESHPARGGWIEMTDTDYPDMEFRPTPHGVGGLKYQDSPSPHQTKPSHPARGGWIEIWATVKRILPGVVPPRTGWVD